MTQENYEGDLKDQISSRNLEESGFSPLREITGILDGYRAEYNEEFKSTRVFLQVTDLVVIESLEPYDFPITEIRITYNRRAQSLWGILSKSANALMQEGQDFPKDVVGSQIHMKVTDSHMLWDAEQQKQTPRIAWEMVSISGAVKEAPVDASIRAMALLEGKTISQFQQAALSDPVIRSDGPVQQAIMNRTFVTDAVKKGLVSIDSDGAYRMVDSSLK